MEQCASRRKTPMPRPKGSADLLEHRRRRARALLGEGRSLHEVARLVACAASSVMRGRDARARGGPQALKVRASPGRPPKLGKRDHPRLVRLLLQGAIAHGYPTDLWTTTRIARLIRQKFGVRYHGDHVGRPVHRIGWGPPEPAWPG